MTNATMLQAAFFQLGAAIGKVEDPMFKAQLRLSMDVLSNAMTALGRSLTPATVNDVEFALNDVAAAVGELNAIDADAVTPSLEMMQADLKSLKEITALPQEIQKAIRELQAKMRGRKTAIERQTYRAEEAPEVTLPYPPQTLRVEAELLRHRLIDAGFATPALDAFIADPSSLRFHSIAEIIDELDVILG